MTVFHLWVFEILLHVGIVSESFLRFNLSQSYSSQYPILKIVV